MDILPQDLVDAARERLKGYCRVCKFCDGLACRGEVPGMGGAGYGMGFVNNITALAGIKLNLRTIHQAVDPDPSLSLFGREYVSPLIVAPMAGMNYNLGGRIKEEELANSLIRGAKSAGFMAMTGDGRDPEEFLTGYKIIAELKWGLPVLKPWPLSKLIARIRDCEKLEIPAVGIDLDGIGLEQSDVPGEQSFTPKSLKELQEITHSTRLPVFFKGIMTVKEAELAVKAGAAGIVVSNHGGRVLDGTPGVASVLAEITRKAGGRLIVLADGGVRSGVDILKYLALGAQAVLVGRPLLIAAAGGGATGVKTALLNLNEQFRTAMMMTGCRSLKEINSQVLWRAK